MPRRELLTAAQREALLAFPDEEENLLQHYVLSVRDLAAARQHRGDHNRLGFAVQLCYLRYPGRVLAENETPPAAVLGMVGAQLQVQSTLWDEYAQRDETRREYLIELQHLYGFQPLTSRKAREIAQGLISLADRTQRAMVPRGRYERISFRPRFQTDDRALPVTILYCAKNEEGPPFVEGD